MGLVNGIQVVPDKESRGKKWKRTE
jgi:hypothetical protein